jgi:hypothetical protein
VWPAAAAAGTSASSGVAPAAAKAEVPGFRGGVGPSALLLLLLLLSAAGSLSAVVMPLLESVVRDGGKQQHQQQHRNSRSVTSSGHTPRLYLPQVPVACSVVACSVVACSVGRMNGTADSEIHCVW